jgi:transposase
MKILALDLGNFKSVACAYDTQSTAHEFKTVVSSKQAVRELLLKQRPDRVVIEICPLAGWMCVVVRELGIEIQVASTNEKSWLWRNVRRKSDRRDGLKLAHKSALGDLKLVHVPERELRQWRALINYRQQLVRRRTKIKNHLRANERVQLLQSAAGVGPRLSEAVVAAIDDPSRFKNGKEVGPYVGLVPKKWQSGEMDRLGHITRQGSRLLRGLLVEASWAGLRYNSWMREIYQRVKRGSKARRKIAIIAVARRLLIRCWAMLRDGARWRDAAPAT